jgi:hypothetical protein
VRFPPVTRPRYRGFAGGSPPASTTTQHKAAFPGIVKLDTNAQNLAAKIADRRIAWAGLNWPDDTVHPSEATRADESHPRRAP